MKGAAIRENASELMRGAVDLHVHAAPDVVERRIDCIDLAREASAAGMAGILIKDHATLTADRARLLNKLYPDFKTYGCIVLNESVGGLNPAAVEAALGHGCIEIFMPTFSSANHISKSPSHGLRHPALSAGRGISILDERGAIDPRVEEILRLIAGADAILGTGHLSAAEVRVLVIKAREAGVKRILITHASMSLVALPVASQIEAARAGAYIEHCLVASTALFPAPARTSVEEMASQIRAVGPRHCILSTDLGQIGNPSPVDGFREFIRQMLSSGFSKGALSLMVRENPKALLEA